MWGATLLGKRDSERGRGFPLAARGRARRVRWQASVAATRLGRAVLCDSASVVPSSRWRRGRQWWTPNPSLPPVPTTAETSGRVSARADGAVHSLHGSVTPLTPHASCPTCAKVKRTWGVFADGGILSQQSFQEPSGVDVGLWHRQTVDDVGQPASRVHPGWIESNDRVPRRCPRLPRGVIPHSRCRRAACRRRSWGISGAKTRTGVLAASPRHSAPTASRPPSPGCSPLRGRRRGRRHAGARSAPARQEGQRT